MQAEHRSDHLHILLANDLSELERLANEVEAFVERNDLPVSLPFTINLCLDELITNVVMHGYPDRGPHKILVEMWIENGGLHIRIRDDGMAFNPFEQSPPPDLESDLEDRPIGGLGVFLVKETMSETHYRREGMYNIIDLIKTLPNTEEA